jgi:hypothetical protein
VSIGVTGSMKRGPGVDQAIWGWPDRPVVPVSHRSHIRFDGPQPALEAERKGWAGQAKPAASLAIRFGS